MGSIANSNTISNSSLAKSTTTDQRKHQLLEPPMSSSSFLEHITKLVTARLYSDKSTKNMTEPEKKPDYFSLAPSEQLAFGISPMPPPAPPSPPPPPLPSSWPKRPCRAPLSRKFAHPCICSQSNSHHNRYSPPPSTSGNNNSSAHLPPAAYTSPLYLYDPHSKKCLPTSRGRDMLLKECHSSHAINTFPLKLAHQSAPCVYDDLVCDARRNRCACKPPLHLYYESNHSSFGCVPLGPSSSADGRINCRSGYIYNVISKDCQKVFDVNELPPNYAAGVSATQFSFVTIVLIWILLLILIVTAKLRKLRTSSLYRNSPTTERRLHQGGNSYRSQTQSTWLHPFIAAVNGHHHLNQHRTTVDRTTRSLSLDDTTNYNDTDLFLSGRLNDMLGDNNFVGSQQSLNNPPPKFEEIYPSCPEEQQQATLRPPSNEDLPSYDEAMRLQNTMPPDQSKE